MNGLTGRIRNYLLSELTPDGRITENDLMERFNVGRSSVRETLKELESEKLIERKRSRGITLRRFSMRDIAEIYDLRATLEGFACGQAASVVTNEELQELERLANDYETMCREADQDNNTRLSVCDVQFHGMLVDIAGNRQLKEIMTGFSIMRQAFMMYAPHFRKARSVRNTPFSHIEIVKAIKNADSQGAERLMREHVLWAKRRLLEQFSSAPIE